MIDILEFLRKHIPAHKIVDSEFMPLHCPFCGGGQRHRKYTMSINLESGAFQCFRMNNCGRRGSIKDLKEFFEGACLYMVKKTYLPPKTKFQPKPNDGVASFLKSRGLDVSTAQRYGVLPAEDHMVFVYRENDKPVLVKHRDLKDKKKQWADSGGKPVFFGMHLKDGVHEHLVITEGEFDAIAVAQSLQAQGVTNTLAVSLPMGANNLSCLDLCWDWMASFSSIIIWCDGDEAGSVASEGICKRIGHGRSRIVASGEIKDANEMLETLGTAAVVSAINNAKWLSDGDIVRACDQESSDLSKVHRTLYGIKGVDRILGGARSGETTLWTGLPSSGKTTILNGVALEAVNQGERVVLYSGEFSPGRITEWIDLQAAGKCNIEAFTDEMTRVVFHRAKKEIANKIREWYADRLFFYSPKRGTDIRSNIIDAFMYAYQRHGASVFIVDNLMKCMTGLASTEIYAKQSDFTNELVAFAQETGTHVHIVAHPRKLQGRGQVVEREDVSGSSNLINLVDNAVSITRMGDIDPNHKEKIALYERLCNDCGISRFDSMVGIHKNRFIGVENKFIPLIFDNSTKRFRDARDDSEKVYGWDKEEKIVQGTISLEDWSD